jgi:predicted O-linked N-acetylglucosamine transferase (SPINDLY family)
MQIAAPSEAKFREAYALHQQRRLSEAAALYGEAVALDWRHADALYFRGVAFFELGRISEAAESHRAAIKLVPAFAAAHNGLGLALTHMGEQKAAFECYNAAIAADPRFASPYINRSLLLRAWGRLPEALQSLNAAVALQPDNPNAHANRGTALSELTQPAAAIASFDKALGLNPNYPFIAGTRIWNKTSICDWTNIDREIAELLARLERGEPASPPWPLIGFADSPALQRKAAEMWIAAKCPENKALGPVRSYPHQRVRIGYYSSDFYNHATAYLMAELFELHDRARFEIAAFSFSPPTGDEMQKRIAAACDHFIDVRGKDEKDTAALSREMEIDIAVDLKGFSADNGAAIFAHRAAPIQVSYLGYPCTMGAPYIDYLIADNVIVPDTADTFYTEKVLRLPHSYQVNDRQRKVSDRVFSRAELGLPDQGFVFFCFNNNFKVLPAVFDIWMRILKAVDGSVLWLLEDNTAAAANLREEAERRGVDAKRLVFAPRMAPDEHLARQRAADLFLDTLPCNAHTTASDALWVGLPLLTCPGESFTSRVAASLLHAMGAPELIAPTLAGYEALAVALAKDPARLKAIKDKLLRNRDTSPLFDTVAYTRDLEALYMRMVDEARARPV